jgi:hypothetical protein
VREEALELAPLGVEDAERDVAGARQVGRDRDQPLEQLVEVQVRDERAPRIDEAAQAGGVERAGLHLGPHANSASGKLPVYGLDDRHR